MSAIQAALVSRKTVIGVALRDPNVRHVQIKDLYGIGTEIALSRIIRTPDDSRNVLAQGRRRVEIIEVVQTEPYMTVKARTIKEPVTDSETTGELVDRVFQLVQQYADLNPTLPDDVVDHLLDVEDPELLSDFVSSALVLPLDEQQRLLETRTLDERLQQIALLLGQEISVLELRDEINNQVQQEMDRSQREVYLREQMRIIQTELGEGDIFQQEINEVRDQIVNANLPADIQEKALKELSRLMMMPPMAPEVGIIRTYIDWLVGLPWNKSSDDNLDIKNAQEVLDEDHYGLPR